MKWTMDDSAALFQSSARTKYDKREITVVLYFYPTHEEAFVSVKGDVNIRIEHIHVTVEGKGEIEPASLDLKEYMAAKEAVDSAVPVLRKVLLKQAKSLTQQIALRVRAGAKRL